MPRESATDCMAGSDFSIRVCQNCRDWRTFAVCGDRKAAMDVDKFEALYPEVNPFGAIREARQPTTSAGGRGGRV